MFTYFYRILDKFNKRVTCVAIFTGNNAQPVVQRYDYDFLGTENHFTYNTYSIIEQDMATLAASSNPFALVVLTVLVALQKGELGEEEMFRLYKDIAKKLLQKNISPRKPRAIMNFLKYYVSFGNTENIFKFKEEIKSLTNNTTTMGIEELLLDNAEKRGIEKGIEKGRRETDEKNKTAFVASLLQNTNFDDNKIASLAGVDVEFVKKIKGQLGL